MKTRQQRLDWAVDLASLDMDTITPGDLLNLRLKLQEFVSGGLKEGMTINDLGGAFGSVNQKPQPEEYSLQDFQKLVKRVGGLLRNAVLYEGKMVGVKTPTIEHFFAPAGGQLLVIVGGSTEDVFLHKLMQLLQLEGADRLLLCPLCRRVFLRRGKRKYCSRECNNRSSYERWVERQKQAAE